MLRILFPMATLVLVADTLCADDKTGEKSKGNNTVHAVFVNADVVKQTVTFKAPDKSGKNAEVTLALAKNAKILATDEKPEAFAAFVKNMQSAKDKTLLVVEDSDGKLIVELRDQSKKR